MDNFVLIKMKNGPLFFFLLVRIFMPWLKNFIFYYINLFIFKIKNAIDTLKDIFRVFLKESLVLSEYLVL
jgi:hypothetical protein